MTQPSPYSKTVQTKTIKTDTIVSALLRLTTIMLLVREWRQASDCPKSPAASHDPRDAFSKQNW